MFLFVPTKRDCKTSITTTTTIIKRKKEKKLIKKKSIKETEEKKEEEEEEKNVLINLNLEAAEQNSGIFRRNFQKFSFHMSFLDFFFFFFFFSPHFNQIFIIY